MELKFHMELLWDGGTRVCSNVPGHMTKMAAMTIYGENLKKSSSLEPKGQWRWNLICSIRWSSTTKFVQLMTLGWPWPILRQGQIWSIMFLCPQLGRSWRGILVSGFPCVHSKHILWTVHARVLKFHIWIPHGKIVDTHFFLDISYEPCS